MLYYNYAVMLWSTAVLNVLRQIQELLKIITIMVGLAEEITVF